MTAPRIVILDQDRAHCAQCCDVIRAAGFEPVMVVEPSQLAAVAEQERAVAALLEAEADASGASVFEALRRLGIPFFGMSATWLGGTNRALGINWDGCADFWEKPVARDELLVWLRRLFPDVRPGAAGGASHAAGPFPAEAQLGQSEPMTGHVPSAPQNVFTPTTDKDSSSSVSSSSAEAFVNVRSADGSAGAREPLMSTPMSSTLPAPRSTERSIAATPSTGSLGIAESLRVPSHLNVHRVGESGSFAETAFATLLARLAYDRATGALMMQCDEDKRVAYLQDGFIVGVKTNTPDDSLMEMLVSQGLITFDQGRRAEIEAQKQQVNLSDVLVQFGFFSHVDMQTLVSTYIRNHLMDVFGWESGVFIFRAGQVPQVYDHEPVVSPMDFIWQGVQFNLPLDYAESAFAAHMHVRMGWMTDPPAPEDMTVTMSQRQFLLSVSAGETLGDLQRTGRLKEPVWRIAYVLASTGFLGFHS